MKTAVPGLVKLVDQITMQNENNFLLYKGDSEKTCLNFHQKKNNMKTSNSSSNSSFP
jgi:hypothetical protein